MSTTRKCTASIRYLGAPAGAPVLSNVGILQTEILQYLNVKFIEHVLAMEIELYSLAIDGKVKSRYTVSPGFPCMEHFTLNTYIQFQLLVIALGYNISEFTAATYGCKKRVHLDALFGAWE